AVADDVRAMLGERPRHVFEEAWAIPRRDRDLDTEALCGGRAVPLDRGEALRATAQRPHVRAVLAVDRDPAAQRGVADDRVAGYRRAALCEPYEHVADTRDDHPELRARDRLRLGRLRDDGRLLGDLVGLQALNDLVDDRPRLQLPGAEREVEVLRLL